MAAKTGSHKVIYAALAGNLLIALTKFAAAAFTPAASCAAHAARNASHWRPTSCTSAAFGPYDPAISGRDASAIARHGDCTDSSAGGSSRNAWPSTRGSFTASAVSISPIGLA